MGQRQAACSAWRGEMRTCAGSPYPGYAGTSQRAVDQLSLTSRYGHLVECNASHSLHLDYQASSSTCRTGQMTTNQHAILQPYHPTQSSQGTYDPHISTSTTLHDNHGTNRCQSRFGGRAYSRGVLCQDVTEELPAGPFLGQTAACGARASYSL